MNRREIVKALTSLSSWCVYFLILSGPSGCLRHPKPAQLDYDGQLAGLVGHYGLFMGSDGKVPWDSSTATPGEAECFLLRRSPKENIVRPFIKSH